ncbi:hypothetical protein IAR50_001270 [Cryptococcus sp. DSM 104548]
MLPRSTPPITRSETSAHPRPHHHILSSYRFPPQPSPLGGSSLLPSLPPEQGATRNDSLHPNAIPSTPSRVPSPARSLLLAESGHDAFEATFIAHSSGCGEDVETPKAELDEDEVFVRAAGEVVDIFQRKPKHRRRTPYPALTTSTSPYIHPADSRKAPGAPDSRRPSLTSSCESQSPQEDSAWGDWSYRMSPVSLLTHLARDFLVEDADGDDALPRGRILEALMDRRGPSGKEDDRQLDKEEERDTEGTHTASTDSITHDYLADFFKPEYPDGDERSASPPPIAKTPSRPVPASTLTGRDSLSSGGESQGRRDTGSMAGKHSKEDLQEKGDEEVGSGEEAWEWDRVLACVEGGDE